MTDWLGEICRLWGAFYPRSMFWLDRLVGGSIGSGVRSNLLPSSMSDRLDWIVGSGLHSILVLPFCVLS